MRRVRPVAICRPTGATRAPALRRGLLTLFINAAFTLLAACGSGEVDATPTAPGGSAPGGGTVSLEVPDLRIVAYQGGEEFGSAEFTLSQVLGVGKPVLLNFYAALCAPCLAEMPDIQAVYEERGHEITVVGVDVGQQFYGTREDGEELLSRLGIDYPAGTTFDEGVIRDFRVVGLPTTLFIRADGSLMRSWSGLLTESKFNEIIDELVAG